MGINRRWSRSPRNFDQIAKLLAYFSYYVTPIANRGQRRILVNLLSHYKGRKKATKVPSLTASPSQDRPNIVFWYYIPSNPSLFLTLPRYFSNCRHRTPSLTALQQHHPRLSRPTRHASWLNLLSPRTLPRRRQSCPLKVHPRDQV